MKRISTKMVLRVLASDDANEIERTIGNWIKDEFIVRDDFDKDTVITVVIGEDVY